MARLLHFESTVLPGNKIEITSPEFMEGEEVEVLILSAKHGKRSVLDLLQSSPPPGGFKTAQEIEEYLRKERDSWER